MRIRTAVVLASLTATLVMAFGVTSASANRLSVTNRFFRITWTELNFFDAEGELTPANIKCPVTLEGSFHSATFAKVLRSLIGYVTRATVRTAGCREVANPVEATFLNTFPWHIRYEGFRGTLPNITRMRVLFEEVAFRSTTANMITCLFFEEEGESISGEFIRENGGNMNTFEFDHSTHIEKFAGNVLCPPEGGLEGVGSVFVLGSSVTRIRLTLI